MSGGDSSGTPAPTGTGTVPNLPSAGQAAGNAPGGMPPWMSSNGQSVNVGGMYGAQPGLANQLFPPTGSAGMAQGTGAQMPQGTQQLPNRPQISSGQFASMHPSVQQALLPILNGQPSMQQGSMQAMPQQGAPQMQGGQPGMPQQGQAMPQRPSMGMPMQGGGAMPQMGMPAMGAPQAQGGQPGMQQLMQMLAQMKQGGNVNGPGGPSF